MESTGKDCELDEMGAQKISVSGQTNSLQFPNLKSESFVVDVERLSQLTDKETSSNSRITLQRSPPRKRSQSEKQINSRTGNKRDPSIAASAAPREAAVSGASMPEKPLMVTGGTGDPASNPPVQHQITIITGNIDSNATAITTLEGRWGARRFSLRRPSPSWVLDPRRILFLFATLSSMGSILLIYFTLSMGKLGGDDSALNW
ncbi:hypothetical protein NMG60_11009778 [Bertholletia excelsa]